jgi:hypothetical protein
LLEIVGESLGEMRGKKLKLKVKNGRDEKIN